MPRVGTAYPSIIVVRVVQSFLWSQSGNGLEYLGLFLAQMREGSYLLQQFAGNHVPLSGIGLSASNALKLGHVFDAFDIPMLITYTERIHCAMKDGPHEITLEWI